MSDLDEKTVMELMRKHLPSKTREALIVTSWKDGIDIDHPAFSTMEFVKAVSVNSIDRITAELDGLASTVEVLESNARVQAKLLADTARKLATAFEDAAKVAEAHGAPYALQTNTGSMMFRAVTDKIAAGIRALASTECVPSDDSKPAA